MRDYFESEARYLKLEIPFDHNAMLLEARALKNRFVPHREDESGHTGWASLSLYGLHESKTENWDEYGYESGAAAAKDFVWTDAAKECPTIMNFLLNQFPCKKYGRVRLMLLEPGGWIGLHSDGMMKFVENVNVALNNPVGCKWLWDDDKELIMEPGGMYAMNLSYRHSVVNNSNEDRFHLIIAKHDSTEEWKKFMNNAAVSAGVKGTYVSLDMYA
jgi:hypothetical protein